MGAEGISEEISQSAACVHRSEHGEAPEPVRQERMAEKYLAPFGERLAWLLRKAGFRSKKEFLDRVGISAMTLHRYEKGEREPSASVIVAMAQALGCSADQLLGLPTQRGISFPKGTPGNDLVECFAPISIAAKNLVNAMTRGSPSVPAVIFSSRHFLAFADAVEAWPVLHRLELLKGFAKSLGRDLPIEGSAVEFPDLTLQELMRHASAGEGAFQLAIQLQAIYAAVVWASYPILQFRDELFDDPSTADVMELEDLREMIEQAERVNTINPVGDD